MTAAPPAPRCSLCKRPMSWDEHNHGWRCDCQERYVSRLAGAVNIEKRNVTAVSNLTWQYCGRHTTPHIREDT